MSCDPVGNLFLTNGYEHDVMVHSIYEYNNSIIDRFSEFFPGKGIAYRSHMYDHIIAIRIETMEGTVLAEYTPKYLVCLRERYKTKRKQTEHWIFTEKGLFLQTDEISRRYKSAEEVLKYYRSDEAVQDLQAMLEAVK